MTWIGCGALAAAVLSATADARADLIRTNAFGLGADAEVREQNGGDDPRGDHWELAARYTPPGSHNQHILTRFDLSGITAADLDSNPLSSLRLFVNRTNWSTAPAAFSYYALQPDPPRQLWDESTITFRNAPGLSYDGDMTTRGFTAGTLYLGDLPFEGANVAASIDAYAARIAASVEPHPDARAFVDGDTKTDLIAITGPIEASD